jgi:hypothetical protein
LQPIVIKDSKRRRSVELRDEHPEYFEDEQVSSVDELSDDYRRSG